MLIAMLLDYLESNLNQQKLWKSHPRYPKDLQSWAELHHQRQSLPDNKGLLPFIPILEAIFQSKIKVEQKLAHDYSHRCVCKTVESSEQNV